MKSTKRLIISFSDDAKLEKINDISKKMIKSLDVEELLMIRGCRAQHTVAEVTVDAE